MADAFHLRRLIHHELLAWKETRAARKAVGEHLRELRHAAGLAPLDVAKAARCPPSMVAKIEAGEQWNADVVKRIEQFFAFHIRQMADGQ